MKTLLWASSWCLVAVLVVVSLPPARAGTSADGRSYLGSPVAVGDGTIRAVELVDAAGTPTAVGLEFTSTMLEGLPDKVNPKDSSLDWHYYLTFPEKAPRTGFDHILVDWHPLGHPPKGIYTVPHFDFHFYVIDQKSQLGIHYKHPETPDIADVTMPAPALIPDGYFIPPGTQVNRMGVHAVPKAAPELHGKPFANTVIYGYSHGMLTFLEGMTSIDYLKTRPSTTQVVSTPAQYSLPGYYPRSYSLTYDANKGVYRLMFGQLKPWHVSRIAAGGSD
jgi:hypothetical protein